MYILVTIISDIRLKFIMVTIITGITGNVSIDDNGDRNADYSLLDMDPDTGEFEVTINNLMNIHDF